MELTHEFTAGTKAKAVEVNQNFSDVKTAVDAVEEDISIINTNLEGFITKTGNAPFTSNQSYETVNVTGATNATPIVITAVAHGRVTNDVVYIKNAAGNTAANGEWTITRLSADTFELNNSVGNGAYTSGGVVYLMPKNPQDLITKVALDAEADELDKDTLPFGTVSTGTKALTANCHHTANFTGSTTLTNPTVTSGKPVVCTIKFTTNATTYPTFTDITWDYTPTWITTKANLVTVFTDDNGTTWYGNHRTLGA